jgi:hypothetical protein
MMQSHEKTRLPRRRGLGRAVLETATLYGLLVWIYSAVVAATDPGDVNDKFIGWLPLRLDTAGTVGFAISMIGFLLLDLIRQRGGHVTGGGTR